MSGETLTPVVEALQATISGTDIISLFATGVQVALPIILIWYGCKWVKILQIAHLKACELNCSEV